MSNKADILGRLKNPVQQRSSILVEQGKVDSPINPTTYSIDNMQHNKAYFYAIQGKESLKEEILDEMRQEYSNYRTNWTRQPMECIDKKVDNKKLFELGYKPLCIDVETASICDLACPFFFRQAMATPDKTMPMDLARKIIQEAGDLSVPSMKFNWRGEPLLHPKLPELIDYAKRVGILETIINTNATELTEKKSIQLIDSGLDLMIYSFDGGTKETYEKNRPGRFKENTFEHVYGNIRKFAETRKKLGRKFPRTRIQMILMEETFEEQDNFYSLFNDCVDEIIVNPYTERGGSLSELEFTVEESKKYEAMRGELESKGDLPYMKDSAGNLWVSSSRIGCEQPYQRLMITYDGKVGMCCYDWGSDKHPVGYISDASFDEPDKEYKKVITKVKRQHKGFELLQDVKLTPAYNYPPTKVQTIKDLWVGDEINKVREKHQNGKVDDVKICEGCTFKDTYHWVEV